MTALNLKKEETIAHYVVRNYDLTTLNDVPTMAVRIAYEATGKALDWIAKQKRADLLAVLLDAGLSPNARFGGPAVNGLPITSDGRGRDSLMMLCVRHQFAEGLQLLLDREADPSMSCDDYDSTILDKALNIEWLQGVEIILKHCTLAQLYGEKSASQMNGHQAPVHAFTVKDQRMLDLVVAACPSKKGLLWRASWMFDKPEIVERLISLGCDVNEPGQEPIVAAVTRGNANVLKLLLAHGADATVRSAQNRTLVQCAGKHAEVKTVLRAWKTGNVIDASIDSVAPVVASKRATGPAPL